MKKILLNLIIAGLFASGQPYYIKTGAGPGTGDLGTTIQIFNTYSLKTIPLN